MARPAATEEYVADQIAARIAEGKKEGYKSGQWLPPAGQLGEELGAHRTTVGRALKALARRRLVVIHPNKGAKVATRHSLIVLTAADILEGMDDWRGFPASVYRAGGQPFNDITASGEVPAPEEVATRLGILAGTAVFERVRIQGELIDGQRVPIQASWSWYTMELADRVPAIRATPATGPSPVRRSVTEAGYRARYDGRARARPASPMERELLELGDPAIVFDIWRLCTDQDGRRIEVTKLIDDADKVEIAYSYNPADV